MRWIAVALVLLAFAIVSSSLGVAMILDDDPPPQPPGCLGDDESTPCPRIVDR